MSRGFCYSGSNGLRWSVNQAQRSNWKLGQKLCGSARAGWMATPAAVPPSWRPRECTGGPGQGKGAAEGGAGGGREPGLCDNTPLLLCLAPLSVGPSLPGSFPAGPLTLTRLCLPCPPPFLAPAEDRGSMDKVRYQNNVAALLEPVQASF